MRIVSYFHIMDQIYESLKAHWCIQIIEDSKLVGLVSELVSICQAKDIEILLGDPDALINPETLEIDRA